MAEILARLRSLFRLVGYFLTCPKGYRTIRKVRREKLTFLKLPALTDLVEVVRLIHKQGIQGEFIEAGCAQGGSALVIAAVKDPARPFSIYDTFELIPPPSEQDGADVHRRYETIISGQAQGIKGELYYGYLPDLYERVRLSFERYGMPVQVNQIHLVKGLFQDTLIPAQPVAFAHLDCDWYESVLTCLQRIEPLLVPGGVLVIDDYDDWSGCKKAVDEYFQDKKQNFLFTKKATLHIQRLI